MYVIYKENVLPEIGGVHPQDIESNIATYNGWHLADCPEELIHEYKEFDFIVIPDEIAEGMIVLSMTGEDEEDVKKDEDAKIEFTEEELEKAEKAKKYIQNIEYKIITRAKIREIKDVEDDLTDLKRMLQSLIAFVVEDVKIPKYEKVLNSLKPLLKKDYVSTMDKDLKKIEKIIDTEVEIAQLVDEYYLSKKLK